MTTTTTTKKRCLSLDSIPQPQAEEVYDLALRLQDAGCFSVVLECIPSELAAAITRKLDIPTIGIGSGPETSGQVRADFFAHLPKNSGRKKKFCIFSCRRIGSAPSLNFIIC